MRISRVTGFLVLALFSVLFIGQVSAISSQTGSLQVHALIAMSEDPENLPVLDSVTTINLKFSEAIDPASTRGNVQLFRIDGTGAAIEEPIYLRMDSDQPGLLVLNRKPVNRFPEGEAYKLVVKSGVKSLTGAVLDKDFIRYFATNTSFNLAKAPSANPRRTQIVVISDIHLGIDDRIAEINHNRKPLADFILGLKAMPTVRELVIAGDLIDTWFLPMDYTMPEPESRFADLIAGNNRIIVDAINSVIAEGAIKVTYVPGNHDITVTEADISRIFPGINQARDAVQGLGEYITGDQSEIVIEHGHKYNFFVAPDPISNRAITKNTTSILPPGYFFTRIATSSVIQGKSASGNTFPAVTFDRNDSSQYLTYLYYMTWKSILATLPVRESFSDKVITTNLDGFTEKYSVNDLLPRVDPASGKLDMVLYKGIVDTWDARQEANGVKVKVPVAKAITDAADSRITDIQSKLQYFDLDAGKRIVVFGHTHDARVVPYANLAGKKTIYANSGTWIDHPLGYPGMTFVVITEPAPDSALSVVNVYQYLGGTDVSQWGEGQAIMNR